MSLIPKRKRKKKKEQKLSFSVGQSKWQSCHRLTCNQESTNWAPIFCFLIGEMQTKKKKNDHDQNDFCRSKRLKDWKGFPIWISSRDFTKAGSKHPNCSFIQKWGQPHIMQDSPGDWEERTGGGREACERSFSGLLGRTQAEVCWRGCDRWANGRKESQPCLHKADCESKGAMVCIPWRWGRKSVRKGKRSNR